LYVEKSGGGYNQAYLFPEGDDPFLFEGDNVAFEGYFLAIYGSTDDVRCDGVIYFARVNVGEELVHEPIQALRSVGRVPEYVNVNLPRPILITPNVTFDDINALANIQAEVGVSSGGSCALRAFMYVEAVD